jgi:hypothetical protein
MTICVYNFYTCNYKKYIYSFFKKEKNYKASHILFFFSFFVTAIFLYQTNQINSIEDHNVTFYI